MLAPVFLALPHSAARAAVAAVCCLLLAACAATPGAGSNGGSARAQSGGTPVNPFTNPGAADTPTAAATGAQPRQF